MAFDTFYGPLGWLQDRAYRLSHLDNLAGSREVPGKLIMGHGVNSMFNKQLEKCLYCIQAEMERGGRALLIQNTRRLKAILDQVDRESADAVKDRDRLASDLTGMTRERDRLVEAEHEWRERVVQLELTLMVQGPKANEEHLDQTARERELEDRARLAELELIGERKDRVTHERDLEDVLKDRSYLRFQLEEATKERDRLTQELASLRDQKSHLDRIFTEVQVERDQLRKRVDELPWEYCKDIYRLHKDRNDLRQEVASVKDKLGLSDEKLEVVTADRDGLRQELAEASSERDGLVRATAKAEEERDDALAELSAYQDVPC